MKKYCSVEWLAGLRQRLFRAVVRGWRTQRPLVSVSSVATGVKVLHWHGLPGAGHAYHVRRARPRRRNEACAATDVRGDSSGGPWISDDQRAVEDWNEGNAE